ncbi:cell division cycle protein 20 homolog [Planococcus citri]|uniref:cell division cycle protein 20 homolog n=1 Tax=Planococcus citri TaxID=170843 RepID=UPI0031F7D768
MSQFAYIDNLNTGAKIDGPVNRGPISRYERMKVLENSSHLNSSSNKASMSFNSSISSSKTPKKHADPNTKKTPSKTPKKSPGPNSRATTPGKSKTPNGGDRFISRRSAISLEMAQYKLAQENINTMESEELDPTQKERQQILTENMTGYNLSGTRILEYQRKAPAPPEGYQNALKVVYSTSKTPMSTKATSRYIPHAPERILDAPDILDDYYLNLVDWSANNVLAVALGCSVYLWNADTGTIDQLLELEGTEYVCSLNWMQEGNLLAVGTSMGNVQLWDVTQSKRLRIMDGHSQRVSSLSWNSYIISSGSRTGQIIHHDVRQRDHLVATLSSHSHEVCGLKWSSDGRYLASGGNDNLLNIWSGIPGQATYQSQPIYSLSAHQAAVKALAWCPWQQNVLASGGGTADRKIRFWNCSNGVCLNEIDTKSQVCSLLWSNTFREIVSGHGFANYQLIIWKYPSLTKVAELTGHTARVLHLALSPDGTTVLSAGADETLRMWRCFVPDKKKEPQSKSVQSSCILKTHIR